MKLNAFFDLVLLAAIFWAVWALRFAGVPHIGALTMAATGAAGIVIVRRRGVQWRDIGIIGLRQGDLRLTFEAAGVIGLSFLLAPLFIALFGPLTASSNITGQPETLGGFIIDIVVFTWVAAAFGEEVVFRGIILERTRVLFGKDGLGASMMAALLQAVWFGAGHASQGLAGMALTGAIGFALALFFLFRARGSLWPQIFAHAAINTTVLTATFIAGATG